MEQLYDIRKRLAEEYQELNGIRVEILRSPSPIDFLHAVRVGRPTIIKGFKPPALDKWSDKYLVETMGDRPISVAVTPDGNADAIVTDADGHKYFVEPHVEWLTMGELLNRLSPLTSLVEPASGQVSNCDVYYLQSQNGNLYNAQGENAISEFDALRNDIPRDVPWASEALGGSPDAVNIWIGNERSVTSVHSDPYENIYTVVRGQKHFTLFPPTEGLFLKERMYPHAKYTRANTDSPLKLTRSPPPTSAVRWSSISDPTNSKELPPEVQPIQITLSPGDTLYLPVGWWHHVRQSGTTIALNWWYDMEARGMGWVWLNFLRGDCNGLLDGNGDSEQS